MFTRSQRLRRSHDIVAVLRRGVRKSHGPLTCYLVKGPSPRTTIIVDKKVSKLAVERNQIKRRLRAALRTHGWQGDLVIRANQGAQPLTYEQLSTHLAQCLRALSS